MVHFPRLWGSTVVWFWLFLLISCYGQTCCEKYFSVSANSKKGVCLSIGAQPGNLRLVTCGTEPTRNQAFRWIADGTKNMLEAADGVRYIVTRVNLLKNSYVQVSYKIRRETECLEMDFTANDVTPAPCRSKLQQAFLVRPILQSVTWGAACGKISAPSKTLEEDKSAVKYRLRSLAFSTLCVNSGPVGQFSLQTCRSSDADVHFLSQSVDLAVDDNGSPVYQTTSGLLLIISPNDNPTQILVQLSTSASSFTCMEASANSQIQETACASSQAAQFFVLEQLQGIYFTPLERASVCQNTFSESLVSTVEDCADRCAKAGSCQFFTFARKQGGCGWMRENGCCPGMTLDPVADSDKACQDNCCADPECTVWQYKANTAANVRSGAVIGCVRGNPDKCYAKCNYDSHGRKGDKPGNLCSLSKTCTVKVQDVNSQSYRVEGTPTPPPTLPPSVPPTPQYFAPASDIANKDYRIFKTQAFCQVPSALIASTDALTVRECGKQCINNGQCNFFVLSSSGGGFSCSMYNTCLQGSDSRASIYQIVETYDQPFEKIAVGQKCDAGSVGNVLFKGEVADVSSCASQCSNNPRCNYFAFFQFLSWCNHYTTCKFVFEPSSDLFKTISVPTRQPTSLPTRFPTASPTIRYYDLHFGQSSADNLKRFVTNLKGWVYAFPVEVPEGDNSYLTKVGFHGAATGKGLCKAAVYDSLVSRSHAPFTLIAYTNNFRFRVGRQEVETFAIPGLNVGETGIDSKLGALLLGGRSYYVALTCEHDIIMAASDDKNSGSARYFLQRKSWNENLQFSQVFEADILDGVPYGRVQGVFMQSASTTTPVPTSQPTRRPTRAPTGVRPSFGTLMIDGIQSGSSIVVGNQPGYISAFPVFIQFGGRVQSLGFNTPTSNAKCQLGLYAGGSQGPVTLVSWTDQFTTKGGANMVSVLHPSTNSPTGVPTFVPTEKPTTATPTMLPSVNPTNFPTNIPTVVPTKFPTYYRPPITISPTVSPTQIPTAGPTTPKPTQNPTVPPTIGPAVPTQPPPAPTAVPAPSAAAPTAAVVPSAPAAAPTAASVPTAAPAAPTAALAPTAAPVPTAAPAAPTAAFAPTAAPPAAETSAAESAPAPNAAAAPTAPASKPTPASSPSAVPAPVANLTGGRRLLQEDRVPDTRVFLAASTTYYVAIACDRSYDIARSASPRGNGRMYIESAAYQYSSYSKAFGGRFFPLVQQGTPYKDEAVWVEYEVT